LKNLVEVKTRKSFPGGPDVQVLLDGFFSEVEVSPETDLEGA